MLALIDQHAKPLFVQRKGVIVKTTQTLEQVVVRHSLYQWRFCGIQIDAHYAGAARQQAQILRQRGGKALLAQLLQYGSAHLLIGRHSATLALQNLNHMQTETTVYQARQNANLRMAEQLASKLWSAILGTQPAQLTAICATGAVAAGPCGGGKAVAGGLLFRRGTAHIQQTCFSALA